MAIDFPNSPSTNQVFTSGGKSWKWNGTSWIGISQSSINADTVDGIDGANFLRSDTSDTMSGTLTVSGGTVRATSDSSNTDPESDLGVYNQFLNSNTSINTGSAISMGSNSNPGATIYAQRIGSNNEHRMGFQTRNSSGSGTTRMTILGSGNVGIGTTQPGDLLHVYGGTDANLYLSSAATRSGIFIMKPGTANSTKGSALVLDSDDSYRLGTASHYHVQMFPNGSTQLLGASNNGLFVTTLGDIAIGKTTTNSVSNYKIMAMEGTTGSLIDMGLSGAESRIVADTNGLGFQVSGTFTNQNIRWKAGAITGATDSHMLLNSSGNLTVTGVVTANSDVRFKSNIRPIENALDIVCSLEGKLYTKEEVDDQVGFIAQEVEQILPSVVHTDASEEKYKSINYASMVAVLTEAIKEQQKQIDELKEKVNGN